MDKLNEVMEELLESVDGGALLSNLPADELARLKNAVSMEEAQTILSRNGIALSDEALMQLGEMKASRMIYQRKCRFNTCPEARR